jgi:primosomal protein N' (replication factor Y)
MGASSGESQRRLFELDPAPWDWDALQDRQAATVVFAEAPRGEFTYLVPQRLRGHVAPGSRVRVPLGKGNRSILAYCIDVSPVATSTGKLKEITRVIDDPPLLTAELLDLTRWLAGYYMCDLGPALEAVVPASVRGQAGTREITVYHVAAGVASRMAELKLSPKQASILRYLLDSPTPQTVAEITRAVICTTAPISALRAKGLIRAERRRVLQVQRVEHPVPPRPAWNLNTAQQAALDAIRRALHATESRTVLLHGVTGSGKTEVYMQAIEQVIGFGREVIVLVPEISLTPQTCERFRSRLGSVAVLHSHLKPGDRHAEWLRIARGEVRVVVGARSAVFAPVPHLGLIVIDEEHESSFKQDHVPRYHAREVAARRAGRAGIPLVLGSATPSLESWYRAQQGEYELISLPERVLERPMPHVETIDLRNEYGRGPLRGAISRPLHRAISAELEAGSQIILLLNRRGFSTHVQCPACGHVLRCPRCDIALTHHRSEERAICHYCNYRVPTPETCSNCRFQGMRFGGLGTQRLEAEVRARFAGVSCLRMDTDSMRKPGSHETALKRFHDGEIQILLGTQMIAKGLDFPNVTLVGVVNADIGLHLPDFRAGERTFQLVTQVAGRTGRGDRGGRVLVQTFSPDSPAIQAAVRHDYQRFAQSELPERKEFQYPPFTSLTRLVFRGDSPLATESFAQAIADAIRNHLDATATRARLLGPVPAPLARLQGKYRFHVLLQSRDQEGIRRAIQHAADQLTCPPGVRWIIDVDAVSMM